MLFNILARRVFIILFLLSILPISFAQKEFLDGRPRTKFMELTSPTVKINFGNTKLNLRYSITQGETVKNEEINTTILDSTNTTTNHFQDDQTNIINQKITRALSMEAGYAVGTDSIPTQKEKQSIKLNASNSNTRSQEINRTINQKLTIEDVIFYKKNANLVFTKVTEKNVKLLEKAGYISSNMTIVNESKKSIKIKHIRLVAIAFDPYEEKQEIYLSSVRLAKDFLNSGSIPGRPSLNSNSGFEEFELVIPPKNEQHPIRLAVNIEELPNKLVMDTLKQGMLIRIEADSYDLEQSGNPVSRQEELASVLSTSTQITVLTPNQPHKIIYAKADGKTALFDALFYSDLKPFVNSSGKLFKLSNLQNNRNPIKLDKQYYDEEDAIRSALLRYAAPPR